MHYFGKSQEKLSHQLKYKDNMEKEIVFELEVKVDKELDQSIENITDRLIELQTEIDLLPEVFDRSIHLSFTPDSIV